ncbi:MAG: hypothetical protein AAF458_21305 [Pseudomonadota bacterium]
MEESKVPTRTSPDQSTMENQKRGTDSRSESLLDQFYTTLRVAHLALPSTAGDSQENSEIRGRIKYLLEKTPKGWRQAYEVEQLMPSVMSKAQLEIELERRFAEAERLEVASVDALKKRHHRQDVTEEDLRALLRTLLNDIQWFYEKRVRRRVLTRRYATRLAFLFLSSFFIFAVMVWLQLGSLRPPGG